MKTFKTRHQFYLPDDLSEALDRLAAKPGASKTAVLTDALRAWIDRRSVNELDERFAPRLDRQTRLLQRLETTSDTNNAVLELLVLHHLTSSAHQPVFDEATPKLGRARYDTFMEIVGRRVRTSVKSVAVGAGWEGKGDA